MKNQYLAVLSIIMFLTCKSSVSQGIYKVIDSELKDKIIYDNSKKEDPSKIVEVYYLYTVKVQNKVEGKEKVNLIMDNFSQKFKLENNSFDYKESKWNITSAIPIPDEWFKQALDRYNYRSSSISLKYGLKY